MKEATGEVSMTVIVLIAVAGIALILTWLIPKMQTYIEDKWDETDSIEFDMSE